MKNKARLAFDMLEKELEMIDKGQMATYKGGTDNITWGSGGDITDALSDAFGETVTSGVDAGGNWVIRIGDSAPIPLIFGLDEVSITSEGKLEKNDGTSINSWEDWFGSSNTYNSGGIGNGGTGGGNGGGGYVPRVSYSSLVFSQPVYNSAGYNSSGYNSNGYNSYGYNSMGYNSGGYDMNGYNLDGYNSAGHINPIIGTYIFNDDTLQNALGNPFFAPNTPNTWADVEVQFSLRSGPDGQFYTSEYNVGTEYGVEGMTYQDSVVNVHTHPNSSREPSARDILSFISDATGYSPNLTTSFIITGTGTTYALVITDKVAAATFLSQNQGDLGISNWAEGTDTWGIFESNYNDCISYGYSVSQANEKAAAAVLQGSGVSLLKMNSNTPFINPFDLVTP